MKKGFLFILIASLISCGPGKEATETALSKATAKKVIARHQASKPDFETLYAVMQISYDDGHSRQSISVSMRMKKDEKIWLSAKIAGLFPIAKALITPEKVRFYEKINRQSFDGDFRLLSHWLGTSIDFEKLQNLLLGQAVYPLNKKDYQFELTNGSYRFASHHFDFMKVFFVIAPKHYRIRDEQLIDELHQRNLQVSYPDYQEKKGLVFPKRIKIVAHKNKASTKINIEYRSLKINVPLSFPFQMPSGYKAIEL